jgi:hypothetical protein
MKEIFGLCAFVWLETTGLDLDLKSGSHSSEKR